jgi:site-specific recombinase XerD
MFHSQPNSFEIDGTRRAGKRNTRPRDTTRYVLSVTGPAAGSVGLAARKPRQGFSNVSTLLERFLGECRDGTLRARSPETIKNYQQTYRQLLAWFPISNIVELNELLLRQFFRRGESDRAWKPGTTASHFKNLAPFIGWCVEQGYLYESPLSRIPEPRIPASLPNFYSDDEVDQILSAAFLSKASLFEKTRNRALLAVLLLAGLRRGELIELKITDIDLSEEVIRVRGETSKARRPRVITMNRKLTFLLRDYFTLRSRRRSFTNVFWIGRQGHAFTRSGLKHLFIELSKLTGIRVSAHKMRHTFATKFYLGSRDIVSLQQLLGHRKITTTMIYTHVLPENTRVSVEQNPLASLF